MPSAFGFAPAERLMDKFSGAEFGNFLLQAMSGGLEHQDLLDLELTLREARREKLRRDASRGLISFHGCRKIE